MKKSKDLGLQVAEAMHEGANVVHRLKCQASTMLHMVINGGVDPDRGREWINDVVKMCRDILETVDTVRSIPEFKVGTRGHQLARLKLSIRDGKRLLRKRPSYRTRRTP